MVRKRPPVEDGSEPASRDARIAGLVDQTRGDLLVGDIVEAEVPGVLEQRLADEGIPVTGEEFDEFVLIILATQA